MGVSGRLEVEAVFYGNGACSVSVYAPGRSSLLYGAFLPHARSWSQVFRHLIDSRAFERKGQLQASGSVGG